MKLSMILLTAFFAAAPLGAGVVFTMDPTIGLPTNAGTYTGGTVLTIGATGSVNLNGPASLIITNPDGSLVSVPLASCTICWAPGYQYFIPGANGYPTGAGGDGINHFGGGGGNFDSFPGAHSPWAPEGRQTTDTSDPGALRFGALAGTFVPNPIATDWFLIGTGGQFVVPQGGATLLMVIVDTFYPNNTGGYTVTIDTPSVDPVPEPSAIWLAFSGFAALGLPRVYRKLSRKG
jgi:hypothetical protein